MNYPKANVLETERMMIIVRKKKNATNIQISKDIPLLTKEEIDPIISSINEESLHGSFYFIGGKLTFQMLLHESLNEKSLKRKLHISIASFESMLQMLEVITREK